MYNMQLASYIRTVDIANISMSYEHQLTITIDHESSYVLLLHMVQ